ncbi:MAG: DUF2203 domain-containing protein [Chlamydiae bacterium]|nr:DUF2203 domain-containing protein [Chlamydiota bacterium]MBI3277815.1 DUF2203 domain-containing protein [Chlamydiota bacterium]
MLNMKFFSIEGASELIPQLEVYVEKLRKIKNKILQKQIQIDTLLMVGGTAEPITYDSSQASVQKDVEELNLLIEEFNRVLEEINKLGCQLKDPDLGLIDFFYIHNDKIVNLCWKSGESKVEFLHDLEKGYTSRQKIS